MKYADLCVVHAQRNEYNSYSMRVSVSDLNESEHNFRRNSLQLAMAGATLVAGRRSQAPGVKLAILKEYSQGSESALNRNNSLDKVHMGTGS